MAALASATNRLTRARGRLRLPVTNAVQIFAGSFCFLSETTGLLVAWADLAANKFVGIATEDMLGTASNPEVNINDSGEILENVDVVGVDNINDVGDLVFASSDNDLTLTANTNQKAVGKVVKYHGSGTKCDVLLFTSMEHSALY